MAAQIRFVLWLLLGFVVGCSATTSSRLHEAVSHGGGMSLGEVRIRVRGLAPRYSGLLESMADEIVEKSDDPRVRLEMLRFKINGIPAIQSALFAPDPVAALIDAWALVAQLQQVIGSPSVLRDESLRQIAEVRLGAMESELAGLWGKVAGPAHVPRARARIRQWAAAHPLSGSLAARVSTAGLLANITASTSVTALGAVATLIDQTQDLSAHLDVLVGFLPKQARWQAEYLVGTTLVDPSLRGFGSEAAAFVAGERRAVESFVESQVSEVARDLSRERALVLEALASERKAVLGTLVSERKSVLAEIDQMGSRWSDQGFDRAAGLLDRLFLRLLLLTALIVAGALVALQLVLSSRRRRELTPRNYPSKT